MNQEELGKACYLFIHSFAGATANENKQTEKKPGIQRKQTKNLPSTGSNAA